VRVNARRIEATLHAAERFDAVASTLGSASKASALYTAWRDLLTAQSHDQNLCEYSRWQGDRMAPLGLVEDHHDQTWGSVGYHHLDEALKAGNASLESSLSHIANRVAAPHGLAGPTIIVFNPCSWERSSLARTGKVYLKDRPARNISVVNSAGATVPFQIELAEDDPAGNLAMVDVTFLAENVPAIGYDTYRLKFTPEPVEAANSALTADEAKFEIENPFVRIRLDSTHGGLVSLLEKKSGKEFISAAKFSTPAFHGQPNLKYPFLDKDPDTSYDSTAAKASLRWMEKGPLRATLRATHKWKQLSFETRVTLSAHSPNVEMLSRVLTSVPPALDGFPTGRAERDINNGYWLAFAPAFTTDEVYRDFPLGVEPTKHERLHGLNFADLTNAEQGLLIIHSGSQYFRKESDGTWSNLVMREWESHFSNEYGFPNYAEFNHALLAHGPEMDCAQRTRAAMEFDSRFLTAVSTSKTAGDLPARQSFVRVSPDNVLLSAFRKRPEGNYELRLLETSGKAATAKVDLGFAASQAVETDLRGRITGNPMAAREITLPLKPWQFRTLQII
jgi:alpha-mannosidase